MIQLFTSKENFPPGVNSYVNVQRQFFESFVGQTFKELLVVFSNFSRNCYESEEVDIANETLL
jgi:hypothetical protein